MNQTIVTNHDLDIFLVAIDDVVLCFRNSLDTKSLHINLNSDKTLIDTLTSTVWDLQGKYFKGPLEFDLIPVAITDEYWFSWKQFHPDSQLIEISYMTLMVDSGVKDLK